MPVSVCLCLRGFPAVVSDCLCMPNHHVSCNWTSKRQERREGTIPPFRISLLIGVTSLSRWEVRLRHLLSIVLPSTSLAGRHHVDEH